MISKIVVLGRSGQVASAVAAAQSANDVEIVCLSREEADLARPGHASETIERLAPELVINAAAYTTVDKAETEHEEAFRINADACGEIAQCCQKIGSRLLHISTDYVFDGKKSEPYVETDSPNPLNVYGQSKLAGERLVLENCENCAILRVSWIYSATGNNFLRTMLRLGKEREKLSIVNDQTGTPNYAGDVAAALLKMAQQSREASRFAGEIFHLSATPATTWYAFAKEIFAQASKRELTETPKLEGIPSSEYPTPAERPLNSVLNSKKLFHTFGIAPVDWRESLSTCLDELETSQ